MLSRVAVGFVVVAALGALACGGRGGSAATLPSGQKIAIMVYADRGVTAETPADKAAQLNEVGAWMENDLLSMLKGTGYDAALVTDKDTPTELGRYLLRLQIVDYNGGSKAARMFVGWGAGTAHLNTHYELVGPKAEVYLTASPTAATSRSDWQHVARKINQDTVDAVNARLHKSL
jgi:hypothetical protein